MSQVWLLYRPVSGINTRYPDQGQGELVHSGCVSEVYISSASSFSWGMYERDVVRVYAQSLMGASEEGAVCEDTDYSVLGFFTITMTSAAVQYEKTM